MKRMTFLKKWLKTPKIVLSILMRGSGAQPIHYASAGGQLGIVKYLVGKGASVYAKNEDDCQTIHLANQKSHYEIVKYLKEKKTLKRRLSPKL